jgi:hypothetical protein
MSVLNLIWIDVCNRQNKWNGLQDGIDNYVTERLDENYTELSLLEAVIMVKNNYDITLVFSNGDTKILDIDNCNSEEEIENTIIQLYNNGKMFAINT